MSVARLNCRMEYSARKLEEAMCRVQYRKTALHGINVALRPSFYFQLIRDCALVTRAVNTLPLVCSCNVMQVQQQRAVLPNDVVPARCFGKLAGQMSHASLAGYG